MTGKQLAVLCDIDGTVAIHDGIRGHYEYEKVSLDLPNWPVINLVTAYISHTRSLGASVNLLIMSGRPSQEQVIKDTSAWLLSYGLFYDALIMRPEFLVDDYGEIRTGHRDFRPDDIVKEELYFKYVEPFYDVEMVFDDRDRVVRKWRSLNLTCLQVADGNF